MDEPIFTGRVEISLEYYYPGDYDSDYFSHYSYESCIDDAIETLIKLKAEYKKDIGLL